MATIAGSLKYGEGHPIILKEQTKLPMSARQKFNSIGYTGGKSIFTLVRDLKNRPVKHVLELANGSANVYLKDEKNDIILVKGTPTLINDSFNHYGKTGKSLTNKLTEIKENISMWMFQSLIETGNMLTEDQVIAKLGRDAEHYATLYYTSAQKQAQALKKIVNKRGYRYERQAQNLTKPVYDIARKLSRKTNDNWNPSDVWMISSKYDITELYKIQNIDELNSSIAAAYKNRDIIPISLKQVTNNTATLEVVDPANAMSKKLDMDFTIDRIMLTESFANFTIETKSGFTVRGGYKGSDISLSVSLEGKMLGSGYQLGAIDAKAYPTHTKSLYNYAPRNGTPVNGNEHKEAKDELKEIFQKYKTISAKITSYEDAINRFNMGSDLLKNRFANLISYLYSFLIVPATNDQKSENFKFCYYSAKKISNVGCLYIVLK